MNTLLKKTLLGQKITDADLAEELHDICELEHSSCNIDCPVFKANGGAVVKDRTAWYKQYGCACFKNGSKMLEFLRKKQKEGMLWL